MPKRTLDFREQLLKDLADPKEAAYYVNAALEDSEEMFLIALRDVAEARNMSKVANEAGVSRESIYRMLSTTGNPTHSSLRGILKALGLRLSLEATEESTTGTAARIARRRSRPQRDARPKSRRETAIPQVRKHPRSTGKSLPGL